MPSFVPLRLGIVEGIVVLVTGAPEESEDADDREDAAAPVPTPSQVMDAIDLSRQFAGAYEVAKDRLNALVCYGKSVHSLLAKHTDKDHGFFTRK